MEKTMKQIIAAQKKAALEKGRAWWFEPGAMKFFDSKVEAGPFYNPAVSESKFYFVTSEQCHFGDGTSAPRKYSVRLWDETKPAEVDTVGEFQQYTTLRSAVHVAESLGVRGVMPVTLLDDED